MDIDLDKNEVVGEFEGIPIIKIETVTMKKKITLDLDFRDVGLIEMALVDFTRETMKCRDSDAKGNILKTVKELEQRLKEAERNYILE